MAIWKVERLFINQLTQHIGKQSHERRHLWGWLNIVFNRVDPERIKEVGPDCAAAEWLLRCGASVRWAGETTLVKDYNSLPHIILPDKTADKSDYKIEEIDATGSCIMSYGLRHLEGLKFVKQIKLHKCNSMENRALSSLGYVKSSLTWLQVSSCGNISEKGLVHLHQLTNLKYLRLFDLQEVANLDKVAEEIRKALPNCEVNIPETS